MKRLVLMVLLTASPLFAQVTLTPVTSECGKNCSGQFMVTDNGLAPTVLTINLQSLTVANGRPVFAPLPSTAHVELSEMSARVGGKQSHMFAYKVHCDVMPCVVAMWMTAMSGHTDSGLAMALHIPHIAYVCEKQKNCRLNTLRGWGVQVK
jgi:hypothetical protein